MVQAPVALLGRPAAAEAGKQHSSVGAASVMGHAAGQLGVGDVHAQTACWDGCGRACARSQLSPACCPSRRHRSSRTTALNTTMGRMYLPYQATSAQMRAQEVVEA